MTIDRRLFLRAAAAASIAGPTAFFGTRPGFARDAATPGKTAARVVKPGEGPALWWLGDNRLTFQAMKKDTNGVYSWWLDEPPANQGPPRHVHSLEEEGFYVLDGTASFQCGDATFEGTPGSFLALPRGVPHSWMTGSKGAKLLTWVAPAGHEGFFFDIGRPIEKKPLLEEEMPDIVEMNRISTKYGVAYLGPSNQPAWGTIKCGKDRTCTTLKQDEGDCVAGLGALWYTKAGAKQTDGKYAFVEVVIGPKVALPPLRLEKQDTALWVRSGKPTLRVGDKTAAGPTGTFLHAPAGTFFGARNDGDEPARILLYSLPAGLEDFLAAAGKPVKDRTNPPAATADDAKRFKQAGARFQVELGQD